MGLEAPDQLIGGGESVGAGAPRDEEVRTSLQATGEEFSDGDSDRRTGEDSQG